MTRGFTYSNLANVVMCSCRKKIVNGTQPQVPRLLPEGHGPLEQAEEDAHHVPRGCSLAGQPAQAEGTQNFFRPNPMLSILLPSVPMFPSSLFVDSFIYKLVPSSTKRYPT